MSCRGAQVGPSLSRGRTTRLGAAAVLALSCAIAIATPARAASGPAVSVWETTADQSSLLASRAGTTFASGSGSASQTITINPATTYQSMTGFGASFTDSSAWLVANSPQRDAIMTKLFDPSQGIGLDFLRQPIGASDFSRSVYSYDDMPAGQTDPTLANFSIAHDNAYVLPILRQALQLNPAITIMATPWSPPGWMKTSGSMIGGTLNSSDYQVFANYLVKFLQAYSDAGVPVSLLTPQNEPEYSPSNYPGSTLSASDEATLIADDLGPAIHNAGLSTQILGYDHNWNDTSFPETVLGSAAGQYTAGTAWHCYSGDPSAQTTVHNAYPAKDTYFTECSGSESANNANTFSDTLDWQTEHLIIGATRNWAKSVVTWNTALDPSGGPSMNCTTCTAVVTVDNGAGTAGYNAEYYVLGQASKFVKPGAVRIDSNTFGSGNLEDVAFANPDGSHALIVLNADTSNARTFNVVENGQFFTYTLPAKAVATFTWTPGGSGGGGGAISATSTIQAESYSAQSGVQTETTSDTGGGQDVGWIANGDWIAFNNVDFGSSGLNTFTARLASGAASGVTGAVEVHLDSLANPAIGSLTMSPTGGWQNWVTETGPISTTTGTHTVYLKFVSSQTSDFGNINWFTFAGSGSGGSASLSASPTTVSFGSVAVGTTSGAQTVSVHNSGAAAASVSSITTTGDFAQSNNCGSSLAAGGSCTVNVTFTPTTTGTRAGTLSITSDATNSPTAVSLSGSGISGGGGGGIQPSTWYQVINVNSGKCVDATNGGTSNGTPLQQWACSSGNTNQEWQFQPTDSGFYKVVSRNATTQAWDVTGGPSATGDGVKIQLWAYGGGTNQQWLPTQKSDGSYTFSPRSNTAECLDVTDQSTADGARLQQWTCTGGANQSFSLTAQP